MIDVLWATRVRGCAAQAETETPRPAFAGASAARERLSVPGATLPAVARCHRAFGPGDSIGAPRVPEQIAVAARPTAAHSTGPFASTLA